ncbi:O-antigen ligase family protein [Methylovorus menthalis]|uniref:O-antigen ligase family protein n=1 Tax=Methylovorus menthalis TaxID=1002227 RepID=UPI001E653B82|nr:O-antigen ligase family protein [Methylovorus menthalis]MCB4811349.1 O-antigen ligase family protein [Methylovorus menthalis]
MNKSLTPIIAAIIYAFIAIFSGLVSVGLVDFAGHRYGMLLAVPTLIVLGLIFIADRYVLFLLVLLVRASIDQILDTTKFAGIGLGGALNALIILIAFLAYLQADKHIRKILFSIWLPFLAAYIIAIVLSPERVPSIKLYLSLISTAAVLMLGMHLVKTEKDFFKWLKIILLSSVIPLLYGFVMLAVHSMHHFGSRINSTFNHPNVFAFYLVLVISIGFYAWKSESDFLGKNLKKWLPIYLAILCLMLVLTQTRSAWLGFAAFFTVYALLYERRYLILVVAMPIVALMIPEVRDRLNDLSSGNEMVGYAKLNSYAWRKYLWECAMNWMQPAKYIFGYGAESFKHYSIDFFPLAGPTGAASHNIYYQVFFEMGIVGLLAYIWLYLKAGLVIFKFWSRNRLLVFVSVSLIVEYLMFSYSDNMMYYLNYNWYFWFFIGSVMGWLTRIEPAADSPVIDGEVGSLNSRMVEKI